MLDTFGLAATGAVTASGERQMLSSIFWAKAAAGEVHPLLIPHCLLGNFVLPILYLTVPHVGRTWLHRARYLVFAVVLALNVQSLRVNSSANFACAYATGLLATWGTVWAFAALICSDPQLSAERVERRRRPRPASPHRRRSSSNASCMSAVSASSLDLSPPPPPPPPPPPKTAMNGHTKDKERDKEKEHDGALGRQRRPKSVRFLVPPDEDVARSYVEHEYYWQAFPAHAPFLTRLDWAFDYYTAWRGSGWSHQGSPGGSAGGGGAVRAPIPRFEDPQRPLSEELVKLESIPAVSAAGYERYGRYKLFVLARLKSLVLAYLVLDLCAVLMTRDPYFVFGPPPPYISASSSWPFPPPRHLSLLHPVAVHVYRSLLAFLGMLSALHLVFSLDQLARHRLMSRLLAGSGGGGGVRAELWHYPSPFGSFEQVLDHGLAGFWGRWWHQTFRVGFTAPAAWLVRKGWLPVPDALTSSASSSAGAACGGVGGAGGRATTMTRMTTATGLATSLLAFLLSGCLHAGGSYTMRHFRPGVRPWQPWLFFALSWLGVALQSGGCALLRDRVDSLAPPRSLRRLGNLAFASAWLLLTCWALVDDLCRSGLWLFEPVPFSPLRALGFGEAGDDAWWRWSRASVLSWHVGEHWWECGLAV